MKQTSQFLLEFFLATIQSIVTGISKQDLCQNYVFNKYVDIHHKKTILLQNLSYKWCSIFIGPNLCPYFKPRNENQQVAEVYSEPCHIFNMERFARIVNGLQPLKLFLQSAPCQMFDRVMNTFLDCNLTNDGFFFNQSCEIIFNSFMTEVSIIQKPVH